MAFHKGAKMPQRKVRCLDCACDLLRSTHWRTPRCTKCRRKHSNHNRNDDLKVIRQQARQYRIVLHVLGWEPSQFWEMLEEMKKSPMMFRRRPEGRLARLDISLERRAADG